jgi:hypothetical protein
MEESIMVAELRDRRFSTTFAGDRRSEVEDIAAEITEAAYPIALKHKPGERWLDLQLGLWHAIQRTVRDWQQYST